MSHATWTSLVGWRRSDGWSSRRCRRVEVRARSSSLLTITRLLLLALQLSAKSTALLTITRLLLLAAIPTEESKIHLTQYSSPVKWIFGRNEARGSGLAPRNLLAIVTFLVVSRYYCYSDEWPLLKMNRAEGPHHPQ